MAESHRIAIFWSGYVVLPLMIGFSTVNQVVLKNFVFPFRVNTLI